MTKLVTFDDIDLYENDLRLFNDGCWLNDTCVSFGLKCAKKRSLDGNLDPSQLSKDRNKELINVDVWDASVVSFLLIQCDSPDEFEVS